MHFYSAYGLNLGSEFRLPELREIQGVPDVFIRSGKVALDPVPGKDEDECSWIAEGGINLFFKGSGAFAIRGGSEITVDAELGAEKSRLRLFLLGAAFAVLLHQRGIFTLHASSVVINGHAVAFVGHKGWGKSTLAATMVARGHPLLSDDIVPISWSSTGRPLAITAFPQLKLWPDAVSYLGSDPEALPRISPLFDKRNFRVGAEFSGFDSPLKAIIMLGKGESAQLEILPPQEKLKSLLVHSYSARFAPVLLQDAQAVAHFQTCAKIAQNVPFFLLKRRVDLDDMPLLASMVEDLMTEFQ